MTRPARILHLRASNFVGGPEKQLFSHAKSAVDYPFEIILGTFVSESEGNEFIAAAEKNQLKSLVIPNQLAGRGNSLSCLVKAIREQRIDLLCTHGYKADVVGELAARQAGIPVAVFLRGWTGEDWKVRRYEALDRLFLPLADRIVCLSDTQAKRISLRKRLAQKIRVVPNSVEVPEISSEARLHARRELGGKFGLSPDARIIAAAGRLSPEKGAAVFLQAVPDILRLHPSARIIFFGDGPLQQALMEQAAKLGVSASVVFAGFVPGFRELLPGVDILVNPSLSEEMPNVVLESMAAQVPLVATAVGAVREIAGTDLTVEIVPPGQPKRLADAVVKLLSDSGYSSSLALNARDRVQSTYSPERQNDALRALYRELLPELPRPKQSALNDPSSPFISVVIPVRNEEQHLGAVIEGLLSQAYPKNRYEILVADGNSTDGTARLVESLGRSSAVRIRLLPNPRQLSSAGRNVGMRASAGEIVVFIDGHCHISSNTFLADTAELFRTTGADCLCRPQPLTAPGGTWLQKVVADVRASAIGHGPDSTIYGENREGFIDPTSSGASYLRTTFERIGEYDERLDACEDVDFNYRVHRAGLRSFISPRLTVQYQARGTFLGLWKQMVRYGKGRFRFVSLHPEAFSVGQAIPPLFVLWLVFGGIAALESKFFGKVFFWTAGLYAVAVIASSAWLGIKFGWRHMLTAPAVYGIIHAGLGYGFLLEAVLYRGGRTFRKLPASMANAGGEQVQTNDPSSVQVTELAKTHPEEVVTNLSNPDCPARNALSVDVEDYYHTEAMSGVIPRETWEKMPSRVEANTRRVFELLAKHNVRATFFFLGWVAEHFPALVREAVQLGHEIGCHSFWHRRVYTLDPDTFRADTLQAKQAIENASGVRVRGYRAPSFSIVQGAEWAFDVLAELGFEYDSSANPVRHDLYNNPSAPRAPHRLSGSGLLELPIATTQVGGTSLPIGGGGYMRMLPYAYTRWGLARFLRLEARPAVVYFHPWEIDPEQPRLTAPMKSRLRQYTGLHSMESKLLRLLQTFPFAPISTVFDRELKRADSEIRSRDDVAVRSEVLRS
jgi:polysaccharide deacetylase family protein (PEP-CTERM system associated)